MNSRLLFIYISVWIVMVRNYSLPGQLIFTVLHETLNSPVTRGRTETTKRYLPPS